MPRSEFEPAPRSRAGRMLAVVALLAAAVAVPWSAAGAFGGDQYSDRFVAASFGGNDGTLTWSTPWLELGEADGAATGDIRVDNDGQCLDGNCLVLGRDGNANTASAEREADLSGATSATLRFTYLRHHHGEPAGQVDLAVSRNGGSSWTTLGNWNLTIEDASQVPAEFDLTPYVSADTRIRFRLTGDSDGTHMNIDNVSITLDDSWYLKGDGTPSASLGAPPTQTSLPNYDPSHDTADGLLLEKTSVGLAAETDPNKHQWWISGAGYRALDGPVRLTIWSALSGFDPTGRGVLDAGLYDCFPDGSDCNLLATARADLASWAEGETTWVERQLDFGSVTATIAAGRSLGVKTVVASNSSGDMMLAYDTVSYPSRLSVTLVAPTNQAPIFDQDLADRSDPEGTTISLPAAATDPDGDNLTYSATGLPPGLTIDDTTGAITGTIDYTAASGSPYTVTLTVTDDGVPPRNDVDTFTWTTPNTNRPPTFNQDLADRSDPEGTTISLPAAATDPDGDNLTYSATGLPPGLNIDDTTGAITGTIAYTAAGTYSTVISVNDDGTPAKSGGPDTLTWTVTNTNRAPSITNPGEQTGAEMSAFSVTLTASDPDGTTPAFSHGGTLPAWASLTDHGDGTATIAGTPGPFAAGRTSVTVTVSDGGAPNLSANATFDLVVANTNRPPAVEPIGDRSAAEGTSLTPITVRASDPDLTIPAISASGLPGWANLVDHGDGTATISGTPGYAASGDTIVTITASDGGDPNLSASTEFTLTVTPTNRPPQVVPLEAVIAPENTEISVTAVAVDPDGDTITFHLAAGTDPVPAGATITSDGVFSWVPDESQGPGEYSFLLVASDDGNPVQTAHRALTVTVNETNSPPVVSPSASLTVTEGTTVVYDVEATDPDVPANKLSYSLEGAPTGASIDASSGRLTWTPSPDQAPGSFTFSIVVTDNGVPALTARQTVSVDVRALPAVALPPEPIEPPEPPAAEPVDESAPDPEKPPVVSPPTDVLTPAAIASSKRKSEMIASIIERPELEPVETSRQVQRTLVLMSRAMFTTVSQMGIPMWILVAFTAAVAVFGRVAVAGGTGLARRRTGTVGWYDAEAGFGFIIPDDADGPDDKLFVHSAHIRRTDLDLSPNDRVKFRMVTGDKHGFARSVSRTDSAVAAPLPAWADIPSTPA